MYPILAKYAAANIRAERKLAKTPSLKVAELSAVSFSAENFFMKNIMSQIHPPNLAPQSKKLRMDPKMPPICSAPRNWLMNIYTVDTAPRTSPAFAAVSHMFRLKRFCAILIRLVAQR